MGVNNISLAITDIIDGFKKYRIWLMFGWFDIKLRYRRSLLGPFWITLSIGIMVTVMGFLYSQIFNQDIQVYLPFVGCSLIIWFFISTMINEGCTTFINAEQQIKQVKQPLSVYSLRLLWRNVVIFLHNIVIIVGLLTFFNKLHFGLLAFIPLFLFVCLIFFFLNIVLGMLCARYRDIPQIVQSITQVLIFVTPVFWRKEFITKHAWVTLFNPLFHILEILRAPLLNTPFPFKSLYISIGIFLVLIVMTIGLMAKYRDRVAYWV